MTSHSPWIVASSKIYIYTSLDPFRWVQTYVNGGEWIIRLTRPFLIPKTLVLLVLFWFLHRETTKSKSKQSTIG